MMDHHPPGIRLDAASRPSTAAPSEPRLAHPATEPDSTKGKRVRMALFIGTHQNKLDAKGRVSIPAQFRSALKKMSHAGEGAAVATVYLRPSHQNACIEGWTEF